MTRGERIRNARISAGLSQTELADLLGVRYQAVNKWENNKARPTVQLQDIANACGVPLVALTGPSPTTDKPSDADSLKKALRRPLGAVSMLLDEHLDSVIDAGVRQRLAVLRPQVGRRVLMALPRLVGEADLLPEEVAQLVLDQIWAAIDQELDRAGGRRSSTPTGPDAP